MYEYFNRILVYASIILLAELDGCGIFRTHKDAVHLTRVIIENKNAIGSLEGLPVIVFELRAAKQGEEFGSAGTKEGNTHFTLVF